MTLREYLELPWTVEREVQEREDGKRIIGRVKELEGFKVIGRSEQEFERNFWDGLHAFLESMIDDGEEPPLPDAFQPKEVAEPSAMVGFVRGPAAGSRPDDFTRSKDRTKFLPASV